MFFIQLFKSKKNLISFLLLLLMACMLGVSTFAWMAINRNVNQELEMQIDDAAVSGIAFTAIKYDINTNLAAIVTGEDIKLPLYDSVFVEQNEHSCLIFRAPVFGRAIDAGTAFTLTLDLVDYSGHTGLNDNNYRDINLQDQNNTTQYAIAQVLSNAAYIKCGVIQALQTESFNATMLYSTAHTFFEGNSGYETHTFFEGTNGQKTNSISFTISDYSNKMANDSVVLYLYLEIGYDPTLVNDLITSRGLELGSNGVNDNTIVVDGDMNQFVFSISHS